MSGKNWRLDASKNQWLWPLVFFALVILGAVLLDGGYAHYEGQFFLVNYIDGRALLPKIFSAHFNEWDCYQGRELSFVFGWLDAELIRASARAGLVHFYSITHFAGLFALAVTLWRTLPRIFPELEQHDAGLITALLLTTPTALFSGYYYRPAKILAALFLALVLAGISKMREGSLRVSPRVAVAVGVAATLMGMSDRLGIYMLLLAMIALIVARPFDRASRITMIAMSAALLINVVWSIAIGPRLSTMADGYAPNTIDQVVHLRFTFLRSEHYAPALSLFRDHIEYFFGNFGIVSLVFAGVGSLFAIIRTRSKRDALTFVAIIIASVAVYVAMYARLSSLPWPASRRVYYWLPQLVVLATGAAFIVARSRRVFTKAGYFLTPLLMSMIAGNLFSIPSHRAAIKSQEHRPWIEQSASLRECVGATSRAIASFGLDAPYAQICGSLRAAAAGVEWDGTPATAPNPKLYCPQMRAAELET